MKRKAEADQHRADLEKRKEELKIAKDAKTAEREKVKADKETAKKEAAKTEAAKREAEAEYRQDTVKVSVPTMKRPRYTVDTGNVIKEAHGINVIPIVEKNREENRPQEPKKKNRKQVQEQQEEDEEDGDQSLSKDDEEEEEETAEESEENEEEEKEDEEENKDEDESDEDGTDESEENEEAKKMAAKKMFMAQKNEQVLKANSATEEVAAVVRALGPSPKVLKGADRKCFAKAAKMKKYLMKKNEEENRE